MTKSNAAFATSNDFPEKFLTYYRYVFFIKRILRWLRVQHPITRLLGFQYTVASDLIEIDLTYLCNLRCNNCNRSSAQAPEAVHIELNLVRRFVDDSLAQNRSWTRIRLLGGEPTLHPQFDDIVNELLRYKAHYSGVRIQVVSNGFGHKVQATLQSLPSSIEVENSGKTEVVQPGFGPFNLAPQDSFAYAQADFRNGCEIASTCGVGLTPQGYYPCALAGGIDRVLGLKRGRTTLPDPDDEMRDLMAIACRLCGRFRDGHFVPIKLRPQLMDQKTSPTWQHIYSEWHKRKSTNENNRQEIQ
ncbi:radical SAM protein [Methylovulum psychrotolerans]|uniref:Radical SAM core domain-containing protein n=1 Tax=Methylovulum psychrotolerans TaxID=1704499 RepID=A0A2S5CIS8_9GAMM|nr:radical SAM protein [Methylovulum psychrotolerans]POZ50718.1 hypothetical protein AADEFJLK_03615 [Methylovulum psychrotolerans]